MATYRILTDEELKLFKDDFIEFLVVNGITAEDWMLIKEGDSDKAHQLIDLFSDVVFEKIMKRANFLESFNENVLQAIQCLEDKMILIALKRKDSTINLKTAELTALRHDQVALIKGEKKYMKSREEEMFSQILKGFQISDGQLFKQLILSTV
jgi:tRNA uridine 5-carbamoylmethylation protein Kti12